ncbi:S-adenosyl-L-methionine-dependent methyltransferase, partial [Calocera viscosa TUFC12733]
MLPTPDLSHLTRQDFALIYQPAEDTFILLDALERDAELIKTADPTVSLEIGSGSGCVSAFIGQIMGDRSVYLCTDINDHAARCTLTTGQKNKVLLNPVITSLIQGLSPRLLGNVDLLVFNPPYVPTDEEEVIRAQSDRTISGAWAGGSHGMSVAQELLRMIPSLLSKNGYFYLVALRENNPPAIAHQAESELGLTCTVVLERRAGIEHLFVLRFSHKNHHT